MGHWRNGAAAGRPRARGELRAAVEKGLDTRPISIEELERLRVVIGDARFVTLGGQGRLSRRAREKELAALTNAEATSIEALYEECFGDGSPIH